MVSVVAFGFSHRTAPLPFLEQASVGRAAAPKLLHDLLDRPHLHEAVVLSTCHRVEVYVNADRFHGAYGDVRDALCEHTGLAPESLADHLFSWFEEEAVEHLFSVAAGLESAVLGEHEILGQVRTAWEAAQQADAAGPTLNLLFRRALEVGKRVRTETAVARGTASLSHAAVELAAERLGGLAGRRALVVGAGEMGGGLGAALRSAGVAELVLANRSLERAEELAARFGAVPAPLTHLVSELVHADVVLTSTGSDSVVIEQADVLAAVAARDGRPLLIVDLAVPRDVDPGAAEAPGVALVDLDDLRRFAERGLAARERELGAVQRIVSEELARYTAADNAREAAPVVAALRSRAEELRLAELAKLARRADGLGLDAAQLQAVDALTRGLLAKLLHQPSVELKAAAGTERGARLAQSAAELFGL